MANADVASRFPVVRAVVCFLLGASIYAAFPLIAPLNFGGQTTLPSLGLGLGIAVGVACSIDARLAPALAAGGGVMVVIGSIVGQLPVALCLLLGLGVALEIVILTWLLSRTNARRLEAPIDVLALVLVSALAAVFVAVVAALLVRAFGEQEAPFWNEIRLWATDDTFGLVVVAPAVIVICTGRARRWSKGDVVEFTLMTLLCSAVAAVIFFKVTPANPGILGWPYLALLGPAWVAVRLGVAAVAPIAAVVFWIAALATVLESGPFSVASGLATDRLVAVEIFAIVLTSGLLALGVLRDDRLRQLRRARDSSRLLREVIDGSDALMFAKEYDTSGTGRYVLTNSAWEKTTGLSREEVVGKADAELFEPALVERIVEHDHLVLAYETPVVVELRNERPDDSFAAVSASKFPLRGEDGSVWGVGGIATDVSEIVRTRERELQHAELLRAVFELSPTPAVRLVVGEEKLRIVIANAAMLRLLGISESAVGELDLLDRMHPDDRGAAWDIVNFALTTTGAHGVPSSSERELRLSGAEGRTVWVLLSAAALHHADSGDELEVIAQFEDVTARHEAEVALSDLAMRDSVTGLPNRRAFGDRLAAALDRLNRVPGSVAVLFCDLDRFKDVNDRFGHQVGDELLVVVAGRMLGALRPDDTIARLGGDEFVVLLEGVLDTADAVLTALRLQDRIGVPWTFAGQTFQPEMSVGVALTREPEVTADELLRRADLAMYRAKDAGRNRIELYQRAVDDEIQRAVSIQHDLRRAIDSTGLLVHYQPIVRLSDRAVVAAEALVRMRGDDGTLLLPDSFVPQAEATGLVVAMGAWVLRQAMTDLKEWRERGFDFLAAVNVSQWQHREEGFARFVLDQANTVGIDPTWLVVEVTETALLHDPARSGRELSILRRAGIEVALDDFGTGYSSLSWLTQLPVSTVKIDQSFTVDLGQDKRKGAIVRGLIDVSHDLGLTVVAEGVETPEQLRRLADLGCDQGQGFLFGYPAAVDDAAWLA